MKAAQYLARNSIALKPVTPPTPLPNEVHLSILWCGICGSDLHEYTHGPFSCPSVSAPHPLTKAHIPITLGHEFCGRVLSAPKDSGVKEGDLVVVDPRIVCRKCSACRAGESQCCVGLGFKGISGTGGGFADEVAVEARMCYVLPPDTDPALATLIEPLAVAWHAVVSAGVVEWTGKAALVVGGGPVGIACAVVLKALGCQTVVASEPTKARRQQNESVADVVLDPTSTDVGARCKQVTGGEGVDVVFDCAGNQRGFEAGMDALRFKGTYMNVAIWFGTPMHIPFISFLSKEITVKSSLAYNDQDFKDVVDAFVAGKFKGIESMVTSKIHLDEIVEKGFDELVSNRDGHVKILVTPHKSMV